MNVRPVTDAKLARGVAQFFSQFRDGVPGWGDMIDRAPDRERKGDVKRRKWARPQDNTPGLQGLKYTPHLNK